MSDIAIQLDGITKHFRRFRSPGLRALNALGIPVPAGSFDTFTALESVSLTVRQGEKVALIGRNGAGKTTLLRLISKQIQPDSGHIRVAGNLEALMELGTGFHPDFNALQNIRSALAYQGVSGAKVAQLEAQIIDFAELDDFIMRPVREYSTGMYARLAFAVATSIEPDILIIDEILGAGDAYFVGKSIQRMKELTSQGATVLFVSHDMSAVQMLCDRGVWIDGGRVREDSDVLSVSKAYNAFIREEEEVRLRMRSMTLSRSTVREVMKGEACEIYRFVGEDLHVPKKPFLLSGVRFRAGATPWQTMSLSNLDDTSRIIDEPGSTDWSRLAVQGGKLSRAFSQQGGRFKHAPFQIDWRGLPSHDRKIELTTRGSPSSDIAFERFDADLGRYERLGTIAKDANWSTRVFDVPASQSSRQSIRETASFELEPLASIDRYGDGDTRIVGFAFFDSEMRRRHTLVSGEAAAAVLRFEVERPVTNPVGVVAIYRPDGTCAMQVFSNRLGDELGVLQASGLLRVRFTPLLLGPGDYIVSVALFKALPLSSGIEPPAYDLHDRCYALKVLPPAGIAVEIGTVNQPASWDVLNDRNE